MSRPAAPAQRSHLPQGDSEAAHHGAATLKDPPRPPWRETLRLLPELWRDPPQTLLRAHALYGDLFWVNAGPLGSYYLVSDPAFVSRITTENHRNYRKGHLFSVIDVAFGNGLLTAEGESWQQQRRILQPRFRHEALEGWLAPLRIELDRMLGRWDAAAARGEILDLEVEMRDLSRSVILQLIAGADLNQEVEQLYQAFIAAAKSSLFTGRLPTRSRRRLLRVYRRLDSLLRELILDAEKGNVPEDSLLSYLLHARDPRSNVRLHGELLRNELVTLVFAGFGTTAQLLTWAWYLLGQHPAARRRLQQETNEVLQTGLPGFADFQRLTYTGQVLQEAARLYPPSWTNGRFVREDDHFDGYRVRAGAAVIFSQYVIHRHPDYWDDPEIFRPERFAPEANEPRHPAAYFPFGLGPRNCIGRDLGMLISRLSLASLAHAFTPELIPDHPVVPEPIFILRPQQGVLARLRLSNRGQT